MKLDQIGRRDFLKVGGAAAGLVIGFDLPANAANAAAAPAVFTPNAFLTISAAGPITFSLPKSEMGQGALTAITMLVAEELEVDPKSIVVEIPGAEGRRFAPVGQSTGGSTGIRQTWVPVRTAGAAARMMLISAAAQNWKVDASSLRAENGSVFHDASNRSATYASLAVAASRLKAPAPEQITLKEAKDFKLIGKPTNRLEAPSKVNGSAVYGIDAKIDGMKYGAIAQSPVIGGKVRKINEPAAMAIEGVRKVVNLNDAVAVVADDTWTAKQGLAALAVEWDEGENAKLNQADIVSAIVAASKKEGSVAGEEGNVADAMASAAKVVTATYEQPFLAHATMEPANCLAVVTATGCEIWTGTQSPGAAQTAAAKAAGVAPEAVKLHNHLIGGGFGRRLEADMVERAVQVAKAAEMPVKTIWSREEDIRHDMYRPYYADTISAGLDKEGKPVAWMHRIAGSSILGRLNPAGFKGVDRDAVEAAVETPYHVPNRRVEFVRQESPVITSWWRGVGPLRSTFVVESFIDELAEAAKADPLAYRLSLTQDPRARAVLEMAANAGNWGSTGKDVARGIALLKSWDTYMAQVVELERGTATTAPRVKRVVVAVDAGQVVNPSNVVAQMEGGVIFGLTAGLYGEITIANGRVQQSNFHDYRMLRMNQCPVIETHIIPSSEKPGGIGEPPTACIMPALANAMFAATGQRYRKIPLKMGATA